MTDEKEVPQDEPQTPMSAIAETFQKLDQKDLIILYGTGAAFLLGFFPWYSIDMFGVSRPISGFGPWHGKVYFLTCLATAAILLLPDLRKQVLGSLSQGAQALTIPVLTAATLIFGPVFFMMNSDQAFAGSEETAGLMSAGKTMWFTLALLATAAAAVSAGLKWKQSVSAG